MVATRDHRPAPAGGPTRVSRPGRGRPPPRPVVERRREAAPTAARSGFSVSFVTSPAHTRSHRAASTFRSDASASPTAATALATSCGQNDAPRSARCRRSATCRAARSSSSVTIGSGARASTGTWSKRCSATRPSVAPMLPAPSHTTSPEAHSSSRSAGRYPATLAASTSDSSTDAGTAAPWRRPIASASASSPRRPSPMPCHAGRKRPRVEASTGSTSRRRTASDRRRSSRSTSSSTHSAPLPPGRNSPVATRPSPARRSSDARTRSALVPSRRAADAAAKGPCVRA